MSVQKVRLHSTSRMSLNDRFTGLRGTDVTDSGAGLQQRRQVVQASRKNQRLALQMEHRPTVIAALSRGRGRGRGVVAASGMLRGARGARNVIRVGAAPAPPPPLQDVVQMQDEIPTRLNFRATTRSSIRGGVRGSIRGGVRGSTRGVPGSTRGTRGTAMRSARGSIRGINFKTGAPLRVQPIDTRSSGFTDDTNAGGAVPVRKRLAVQGRLTGPVDESQEASGWVRGGFNTANRRGAGNNTALSGRLTGGVRGGGGAQRGRGAAQRGRGAAQRGRSAAQRGRGAAQGGRGGYNTGTGYQTRTFRGRGGRGGNRGGQQGGGNRGGQQGYSQQWANGY